MLRLTFRIRIPKSILHASPEAIQQCNTDDEADRSVQEFSPEHITGTICECANRDDDQQPQARPGSVAEEVYHDL